MGFMNKSVYLFLFLLLACEDNPTGSKQSKVELYSQLIWETEHDHASFVSHETEPLFIEEDTAFIFVYDSSIVKLAAKSGKLLWKSKVNDESTAVQSGYLLVDIKRNQLFYKDFERSYGVLNYRTGQIIHKSYSDLPLSSGFPVQTQQDYIFSGSFGTFYPI